MTPPKRPRTPTRSTRKKALFERDLYRRPPAPRKVETPAQSPAPARPRPPVARPGKGTAPSSTATFGNPRFSADLAQGHDAALPPPSPPTSDSNHALRALRLYLVPNDQLQQFQGYPSLQVTLAWPTGSARYCMRSDIPVHQGKGSVCMASKPRMLVVPFSLGITKHNHRSKRMTG
ncbi:hypothetical protein JB92DRAFT_1940562 [Gautieria morchelliformis]|nr:hypothetical protein JB92DRAFT_1940562 [Gautieria morchelliformis]